MEGSSRPELAPAGVRLAALMLLLTCLFNVAISPSSTVLAAGCTGDEQILLAPAAPRVGDQLVVAVFSRTTQEQVVLIGPAGPIPVQPVPIGDRYVWQEMVAVDRAGEHVFVFEVADGTSLVTACAAATILVAEAGSSVLADLLNPYRPNGSGTNSSDQLTVASDQPGNVPDAPSGPEADVPEGSDAEQPTDAPQTQRRLRPTRTPTPEPDAENGNGNDNESAATKTPTRTPTSTRVPTSTKTPRSTSADPPRSTSADPPDPTSTKTPRPTSTDAPLPTSTKTPRPTPTDTPEPTPTLAPASISSLSPERPVCGQPLTIRGERFGNSKSDVDGRVRIDGFEASISSWAMSEIDAKVPQSVRSGNNRLLEVIVSGRTATKEIAISC